ncbi:MAG: alpha/beta hydrolase [Pseudomonadota bacterium]
MATFTTSDGLNLHYTDDGAGLPVLCLAGLTRTSADFDYVTPHLPNVRLIKMDYRGRGNSDWDDTWQNYTIPTECRDVLELLDTLDLPHVAILGTSRGGLNAMGLATFAKERLLGIALNDIGPVVDPSGLDFIMGYLGRDPSAKTHAEAASAMRQSMRGFIDVPTSRWMEEAQKHFRQTDGGLKITYDPKLRDAIESLGAQPAPDLWPFFDALADLPIALVRGEHSNLLTVATFNEMRARRPDMTVATAVGRGHVPFLDEPEAVAAIRRWVEMMS